MMSRDEWTYATLLVISVLFGFVFKNIHGPNAKKIVASSVGLCMVTTVCGWHSLHSLITAVVNYILIRLLGRRCHIWSFIWCFSYLLFFRMTEYVGLPKVPAVSNAVQLLLTLKMVGLAFEVSDSISLLKQQKDSPDNMELKLRLQYEAVNPTFLDVMTYTYCYIGLLTGPYFKFRTYYDMVHMDATQVNSTPKLLERLKLGLMCTVVFLLTAKFYWIDYVKTDEFYSRSFLYRLWFMIPMFIWFRARMYAAWIFSECVCLSSCFGAYPASSKPKCGKGPTDLSALDKSVHDNDTNYDFETIHNIDVYGCEFSPSIRYGMRSWNMSVQYWLATYIYKRITIKPIRTSVTMAVSAFWHGIHSGYYLSFMTVPLCQMSEDTCAAAFREKASPSGQRIYDVIRWFFRMRELEYMSMAFLLLRYDSTLRYWGSIYFAIHVSSLLWFIAALISKKLSTHKKLS